MSMMQDQALLAQMIQQQQMGQQGGQQMPQEGSQMSAPAAQNPAQMTNPLLSGSQAAMQSIQESLRMRPEQQRRSIGMGLMHLGRAMGNPQNWQGEGLTGALSAVNSGLLPGMEAYQQQRGQEEQANAYALQQAMAIQKMQEEQRRREQERNETKRYHDLMYQEADNSAFEQKVQSGLIPKGSVPFSRMTQKERGEVSSELRKSAKEAEGLIGVGKVLNDIKEQAKKYPDLYKSWSRVLMSDKGKEPSYFDITGKKFVDPKEHAAFVIMKKLKADLVKHEVNAAGSSKNQTDVMKQVYKDVSPDVDMPLEAINYVADRRIKEIEPGIQYGIEAERGLTGEYRPPRNLNRAEASEPMVKANEKSNIPKSQAVLDDKIQKLISARYSTEEIQDLYDNGDLK